MASIADRLSVVRPRLARAGQEHLLHFWDRLADAQRAQLLADLESIDFEHLPRLVDQYVRNKPNFAPAGRMEPAPYYPKDAHSPVRHWDRAAYRRKGEELLRAGKVAAFCVAGGQGTRLGYDEPKGKYPGGAVTGKPLFQCLAEYVLAASRRWGRPVPFYVMTSPINHESTVAFFREKNHFGLAERDVMFFPQGVMPSLDLHSGRVLLDQPHRVATNPDGHGGSLRALWHSGAVADMRARGVEHISYVQVDNPLARVIDPVFIGLHASAPDSSGEMSSKMVAKVDPAEKVGVFASVDGKTQVIEYSDLPAELAQSRDADHTLRFCAGSIAIHLIGVEFVARLNAGGGFALPFHRAEKKVPFVDQATGQRVEPKAPNAVKLETFVFDALPLARASIVVETDRIEEFAPIKNAEGQDSPHTCRRLQTERAARWLEAAGVQIPRDPTGHAQCTLEIGPLSAMDPEDIPGIKGLPRRIEPGASLAL
ncbi:MAG: UDPGP type 1 family protein [Phycisphaerales bacterium]|nr:UDPGP type 1 family protein [Phycisphaerales bacterium]